MAHFHQLEGCAGVHQLDGIAGAHGAFKHAHIDDNALVAVVNGVKDQGFQRGIGVALRGGNILHHAFQHLADIDAHLGAHARGIHAGQTDDILHLFGGGIRVSAGQVNLIQDGHNFQVVVNGQVAVGQRLGFHALAGIHHQDGTLTGSQAAADFVLKVNVARRVDQVELVFLAVIGVVVHGNGAGFDGNAALAFQLHVVQNLVLHGALVHAVGQLQNTVRQCGLAVVNVGNDTKVANIVACHQVSSKSFQIRTGAPSRR